MCVTAESWWYSLTGSVMCVITVIKFGIGSGVLFCVTANRWFGKTTGALVCVMWIADLLH